MEIHPSLPQSPLIKPEEIQFLEQFIRRSLLDLSRPNAVRLNACIRILMTSNRESLEEVCSQSAQQEMREFIHLLEKPEILAPESTKTEADREWVLNHIKQYTLENLGLLEQRNTILPNPEMVIQSVEGGERLKSVVHTTAIRNVVTTAHYVDHIRRHFFAQGLRKQALEDAVATAAHALVRLHDAILDNDYLAFKKELAVPGIDVNIPNLDGLAFIHIAVREGHLRLVEALLEIPTLKVNAFSNTGWTALHLAARLGEPDIVNRLLAFPGIEPNIVNSDGWTPLHWAAWHGNTKVVHELLAIPQIQINAREKNNSTPLHWAARNGQADVIDLLIARSEIEVNLKDIEDKTALYFAAMFQHHSALRALLKSPTIDVNVPDMDGLTPLHWAARNGDKESVDMLLASPHINRDLTDHNQMTAAEWAAQNGFEDLVSTLSSPSKSRPTFQRFLQSFVKKIQRFFEIITAPNS